MITKISDSGIDHLTKLEGFKGRVYKDSAGYPTIGVGHLLKKEEITLRKVFIGGVSYDFHEGLTGKEIKDLLRQDLVGMEECVANTIKQPLNQHQFDALVIFCFNIGTVAFQRSTLVRNLNACDYEDVPTQLRRWNKAGGKTIQGLINRREAEIKIWNGEPEEEVRTAATVDWMLKRHGLKMCVQDPTGEHMHVKYDPSIAQFKVEK